MADPVILMPTRARLKRVLGGRSNLYPFIELYTLDTALWDDDFMSGALDTGYQSTASGAASVAAAISTGAANGAILLDAGTADNGRSDLSLGLHFQGQLNAVIAARVQLSAITSVKLEVGFTDVVSGTDAGAVATKATPTFNATNCAVWVLDTDDNAFWEGVAAEAGAAATTVEAAISPTAATYEWLIVALKDDDARYIRLNANGLMTYESAWQVNAITLTTLLTPWIFVQNRSATQRTALIDRLMVWQRRTTS